MRTPPVGRRDGVLLTRSSDQNRRLLDVLESRGAAALPVLQRPLLDILALDPRPEDRQPILHLDQYDHVILISQNAVIHGVALLADYWPQWPAGLHWYGVGAATGTLLNSLGIRCTVPQDYSSEGLLALPELRVVKAQKVLIIRGAGGGREWLRDELLARGAQVDYLEVYQRQWREYPQGLLTLDEASSILIVLVYSRESLERLVALMPGSLADSCLIVPSERIQTLAKGMGFGKVSVVRPDDEAMVTEILRLWNATAASSLPQK
jgi:uroporphyrinogen-III synthase